jgi:O-antigen/teichoic acid export membrane protein
MPFEPHDPEEFDPQITPSVPLVFTEKLLLRSKRTAGTIANFLVGQGAAQGLGVLAGLFLVRNLSVEAYAQFGVATGFQTVFSVLMDLGFASTIIPLVGDRFEDRAVIGRYVRSARRLRYRAFWILAPVASAAFLTTIHRQHWSVSLQLLLLASILLSLYSSGMVSFFSAPLFLRAKLREYYVPQVISGSGKLFAYIALAFAKGLNAWVAAGLSALSITLNGTLIRRSALKYLDWPEHEDPTADQELLRYVLPATPAIVFSAFQLQISLFLVSIFGTTRYIAEVAALGRIGQFFVILTTFSAIVIEPYIARLSRERLLRYFIGFLLLNSLAMIPVVFVAFRWPIVFIWVLGAKFRDLSPQVGWYILAVSMNSVSSLMWLMNRGRKWVFWSGSILEVVLLLVVQMVFLALVGVRNTHQAVLFAVASSCCYMIAHGYVAIRGFVKGK